jgi:hypothetical protein
MNRLAAGARAEPKRILRLRVNSHPATPDFHTAQREAFRQGWSRRHARLMLPVLQTTQRRRSPFRSRRISALRGSSCPPEPARIEYRFIVSKCSSSILLKIFDISYAYC